MVADQKKDGQAGSTQAADALCKLALMGGAGIARLVGIAGEHDQVNRIIGRQAELDHLVKNGEEVGKAAG